MRTVSPGSFRTVGSIDVASLEKYRITIGPDQYRYLITEIMPIDGETITLTTHGVLAS